MSENIKKKSSQYEVQECDKIIEWRKKSQIKLFKRDSFISDFNLHLMDDLDLKSYESKIKAS